MWAVRSYARLDSVICLNVFHVLVTWVTPRKAEQIDKPFGQLGEGQIRVGPYK